MARYCLQRRYVKSCVLFTLSMLHQRYHHYFLWTQFGGIYETLNGTLFAYRGLLYGDQLGLAKYSSMGTLSVETDLLYCRYVTLALGSVRSDLCTSGLQNEYR